MQTIVVNGLSGWLGRSTIEVLRGFNPNEFQVIGIGSHDREIKLGNELFSIIKMENFRKTSDIAIYFDFAFKTREVEEKLGRDKYIDVNRELIEKSKKFILANIPSCVVLASSGAIYEALENESPDKQGVNSYSVLKLLQEAEIDFSANKTNANFIQTRIFNISGKNINKPNLFAMSNLMTQAIVEKRITIQSPGQITRRYCLAEELIELIFSLAEQQKSVKFDSGGEKIEIRSLAKKITSLFSEFIPIQESNIPAEQKNSDYFSKSYEYEELIKANLGRKPVSIDNQLALTLKGVKELLIK
jgi:nucleoside-diphosphate-sugar epimerase